MRRIEFIISDLFGYSSQTYFNWKKEIEKRPILKMIEKYFTKQELEEFLETGQIGKYEKIKSLDFQKNKILDNFFYEYYSRKPINRDFSDNIFPKFEKYVEIEVEKRREKLKENGNQKTISKIKYFNKYDFFEFLLKMEINEAQKIEIIQTISDFKEIEFFIIIDNYVEYLTLNKSSSRI